MSENEEQGLEMGPDILSLVDEDGAEHQFEMVDSAEVDGKNYVALVPVFDQPDELLEDSGELVVLKVVTEGEEEYLEAIEDEDEFNKIGDFFMERLSDVFDFEDGPEA